MTRVVIGMDPHKRSADADEDEVPSFTVYFMVDPPEALIGT